MFIQYPNLDRLEFKENRRSIFSCCCECSNLDRLEFNNLQKLKYGESSQILRKGLPSGSDRHVNELILSRKTLKVNTNTMTPINQGVFL